MNYSNPELDYSGRVTINDNDGAELYWTGTSIKMNFEGERLSVILKDETGKNYYNVIVDEKLETIIQPDSLKQLYTLASNLTKRKHSVEIFKRNDCNLGKTQF